MKKCYVLDTFDAAAMGEYKRKIEQDRRPNENKEKLDKEEYERQLENARRITEELRIANHNEAREFARRQTILSIRRTVYLVGGVTAALAGVVLGPLGFVVGGLIGAAAGFALVNLI